jgi:DNA-binding response OmpR family regulator
MNSLSEKSVDAPRRARVLIIEDEPLIAENLRAILVDAGFEIAGVAGKVEKALRLIEKTGCDAAIVDANLGGVSAGPAAAALSAGKLPFIVLSGYTREQLPSEFSEAQFIQKPYRPSQLIDGLNAIVPKR